MPRATTIPSRRPTRADSTSLWITPRARGSRSPRLIAMPIRRPRATRRGAALAAMGIALVLAGCAGTAAPTVTASPEETPAPIFATDEEALAAAEAVYSDYLARLDETARSSSDDISGLSAIISAEQAAEISRSLRGLRERGLVPVGSTRFDNASIASNTTTGGRAIVDAYVCLDVSDIRIHDASGADVTPMSRDERSPMQIQFVSSPADPRHLILNSEEPWPGDDFC